MISNVLALWLKFEKTKGINEITETLNTRTSWLARKLIIKMKTKLQQKKLHHRQRTQNILLQWLLEALRKLLLGICITTMRSVASFFD